MLHPREPELDNSLLAQAVTLPVTFTFMIVCWIQQHPAHLASIPSPSVPFHPEEAENRHFNSMAHMQRGFAIQIRFQQLDVLMPDLSGGSEVETTFLLSLLFFSGKTDHEIRG